MRYWKYNAKRNVRFSEKYLRLAGRCVILDIQNGMSDCICYVFAARVDTETMNFDENEVKMKKWVSRNQVLEMIKNNETKEGVSILALLFAFEFYT